MTVTAIADQLDYHIAAKRLTVFQGQAGGVHGGFRGFALHVEYGAGQHLGRISGIPGRAGILGGSGEADLVVEHHVDGAAGSISLKLGHVEQLHDTPLSRKGRVAVDQQRQHPLCPAGAVTGLPGAAFALNHRIDRLQVARVRAERQVQPGAGQFNPGRVSLVVFHVPVTLKTEFHGIAKFGEDILVRLSEDVGQHVQPAAVRHAQHHVADAGGRTGPSDGIQHRDQDLAPFEGETFLAGKAALEERLEQRRFVELLQNMQPLFAGQFRLVAARFHAVDQPLALGRFLDVHELDAGLPAIGLPQGCHELAQGRARPDEPACAEDRIQVVFVQAELGKHQKGMFQQAGGERVGTGQQVADIAITVDERLNAGLFQSKSLIHRSRLGSATILPAELETAEKALPLLRHCGAVPQPGFIEGFKPGAG